MLVIDMSYIACENKEHRFDQSTYMDVYGLCHGSVMNQSACIDVSRTISQCRNVTYQHVDMF